MGIICLMCRIWYLSLIKNSTSKEETQMENAETLVDDPTEDESVDITYSITSYGADYPVDMLVKRMRNEKIKVPTFQRKYVWNLKKASRFIESLLMGLPVPGIFLTVEPESSNLLVIDGQQRLKTLLFFYDGLFNEKVFRLKDVKNTYEGKTYQQLSSDEQQRLDDSIIHATIVRQDEPSQDNSSIYSVFERLNTGGMQLHPQEIRSAIYPGKFAELLEKCNDYPAWREVYGNKSIRLKDQEFILRFFAMYLDRDNYEKPLKGFLNVYMAKNQNLELHSDSSLTKIFEQTVTYVCDSLGNDAFRPKRAINASVFDSCMVGIATMLLDCESEVSKVRFKAKYRKLLENEDYIVATAEGTSDPSVVTSRMKLAIKAFCE